MCNEREKRGWGAGGEGRATALLLRWGGKDRTAELTQAGAPLLWGYACAATWLGGQNCGLRCRFSLALLSSSAEPGRDCVGGREGGTVE